MTQPEKDYYQEEALEKIMSAIKTEMTSVVGKNPTSRQVDKMNDIIYNQRVYFSFRFNELSNK